jgi:hypothetical protein
MSRQCLIAFFAVILFVLILRTEAQQATGSTSGTAMMGSSNTTLSSTIMSGNTTISWLANTTSSMTTTKAGSGIALHPYSFLLTLSVLLLLIL